MFAQQVVLWGITILTLTPGGPADSPESQPAKLPDFDALWDYSQPAATEAKFREILPLAQESGDLSYRLQLETQIARALGLQQKFDEAHRVLDAVDAALAEATEDLRLAQVRSLLERGRAFNSANEAARSKEPFTRAWELARKIGADAYAVDAAHMMAIVEPGQAAVPWFEQGVALAEHSPDPKARGWLGPLYNNLGWTYHDAGKYEQALGVFTKALDWRTAREDTTGTRIAKWCVGRCLRSLNRIEEALSIQQQLSVELVSAGEQDGYVEEELGECLLALGREGEARPHFAAAYELLKSDVWLARDEPARLDRLRELGGVPPETPSP